MAALLLPGFAAAADWQVHARSEAAGYSEPVPIYAFIKGWNAPLEGGSDASAVIRHSLTVGYAAWRVSRVYQDLYDVQASRDAARLYHRVANDLPFSPGERFDVDLRVRLSRSLGWRLAHAWQRRGLGELELGITRWHGTSLTEGRLQAQAEALTADDYRYSGSVDYYYGEDFLFDRPEHGASGQGWGVDLRGAGQWGVWYGAFTADNILAQIRWDSALHTEGRFAAIEPQGDQFAPTFSGREDRKTLRQRLPLDASLELGREFSKRQRLGLASRYLPSGESLSLSYSRPWRGLRWGAQIMAAPSLGAGLAVEGYGLKLHYRADALDVADARWLEAGLSWHYRF